MTDNVVAGASVGVGATFATDEIGGVHYPIQKITIGALDSQVLLVGNTGVVTAGTVRMTLATDVALPAGANVIGHVITDTGSTTAVTGTVTISGAVTVAAGATTIGKAEDAASANADVGVPAMAIQLATPTDLAGTDADYAMLQMSGGRLWASAKVDTALPAGSNVIGHVITDAGSTTAVTGTVTVSLPTGASTAAKQPAIGTAGSASADVITVQGVASMTPLLVTPAANSAVNVAQVGGTNSVTGGVAGTLGIGGNVATNVAIGTNPVNLGAQAVSAENAAVTATRMAQLVTDLVGKLIVLPYANPENFINGTTAAITDTSTTAVIAAAGSGVRNYITQLTVSNSHASVGTFVKLTDGASTILWEGYAAAVGGGCAISFPTPLRGTANTAVNAICVTTGANVIVSASGYKGV